MAAGRPRKSSRTESSEQIPNQLIEEVKREENMEDSIKRSTGKSRKNTGKGGNAYKGSFVAITEDRNVEVESVHKVRPGKSGRRRSCAGRITESMVDEEVVKEYNPTGILTRRQSLIFEKKRNSVDYNTLPQGAEQENSRSSVVAKKRLCINQADETSEAFNFVSNSSAHIRNESPVNNEEPNQEEPYVQVASGNNVDYNLNAEENQNQFASQNVDNNVNAQVTKLLGYAPIKLPFRKSSPAWEIIESSEIFLTMPQQPHFAPLIQHTERRREGKAIALMVDFSNVVEQIMNFRISDPKETIEEMMVTLVDLETHGFNLYNLKNMLECFPSLKESHERVMSELQEMHELKSHDEIQKGSLTEKLGSLTEKLEDLRISIVELELKKESLCEDKLSLLEKLEAYDSEISRLQDERAKIEDTLQTAKRSLDCVGRRRSMA